MSASGVDRNRNLEQISHLKEEYDRRETQLNKKHAQELSKLQKSHAQEMKKVRSDTEKHMSSTQKQTRRQLDEKDMKYGQQIDSMKRVQNSRLRDMAEKYDQERNALVSNRDAEKERLIQTKEQQFKNLEKLYEDSAQKKERFFEENAAQQRDAQTEALKRIRSALNRRADEEKKAIVEERTDQVEDMGKEIDSLKRLRQIENDNHQSSKVRESERRQSEFETIHNQNERKHAQVLADQKEAMSHDLGEIRDKYMKALEARQGTQDSGLDRLSDRVESQLTSLARQLKDAREDANIREIKVRRSGEVEKNQLRHQAQESLVNSEALRAAQTRDLREKSARDIEDIRKTTDKTLTEQSQENQLKIQLLGSRERVARQEAIEDLETRLAQTKQTTENRTKRIVDLTNRELENSTDFYTESLGEVQRNHAENVVEQRVAMEKERVEAIARIKRQAREQDLKLNERIALKDQLYQSNLESQRENHVKEMRRLHNFYEKQIEAKDKELSQRLQNEKSLGEQRLAETQEKFNGQIEHLKKLFEREKIELAKKKL